MAENNQNITLPSVSVNTTVASFVQSINSNFATLASSGERVLVMPTFSTDPSVLPTHPTDDSRPYMFTVAATPPSSGNYQDGDIWLQFTVY